MEKHPKHIQAISCFQSVFINISSVGNGLNLFGIFPLKINGGIRFD